MAGVLAVESTLRVTLALAAAALAGAALWRSSASVRHLVWASALAGSLAMPALLLALPSWRVPILPRAQGQANPVASRPRALGPSRSISTGAAHDRRDRAPPR